MRSNEFRERRRRAAAEARTRGLDGLLVWGRGGTLDAFSDVHYFTNHTSPGVWVPPIPSVLTGCEQAGVVIAGEGEGTLLVSEFCSEEAHIERVRRNWDLCSELLQTVLDDGLAESRIGLIGTEVLPHAFGEALTRSFPRMTLEPVDDLSAALRRQLSAAEIELMRYAGLVGARIYRALVAAAQPTATEGEAVGNALAVAARIPGCAHWNFLASSGPESGKLMRTAFPSWDPGYQYSSGDVIHIDCFGFVYGYSYDLARTVVVGGERSERQIHVIDGTREACERMARELRPGVTPRELRNAGSATLDKAELRPVTISFGHGIGAGFFRPYLIPAGPDLDLPLYPALGISFEVFATDDQGHFAYHEDNYLLLDDGTVCVTVDAG